MSPPTIPAWFTEQLDRYHGMIRMRWLRWSEPNAAMLPILGLPISRFLDEDRGVWYRYRLPGAEESTDWFRPEADCITDGRYIIEQETLRAKWVKVFDCIMDNGRLFLGWQEILNALGVRDDKDGAWRKTIDQITAAEAYHQDDLGEYQTKEQYGARVDAEDAARDDMDRFERKAGPLQETFHPMFQPPVKHSAGFTVTDRRRVKPEVSDGSN